jgi:hypothetical protein
MGEALFFTANFDGVTLLANGFLEPPPPALVAIIILDRAKVAELADAPDLRNHFRPFANNPTVALAST